MLEFVHPILAENVRVTKQWILYPKRSGMIWIRRGQWEAGEIEDP